MRTDSSGDGVAGTATLARRSPADTHERPARGRARRLPCGSACLAVRGVPAAPAAVLLQFDAVGVVAPVLRGGVVAVLAHGARQGDLGPDVGGRHGGFLPCPERAWARPVRSHGVGKSVREMLAAARKALAASRRPGRGVSCYLRILMTRPAPTVRPPSRIANRKPSAIATGWISRTVISVLSPGIAISVPSGSVTSPVTSVVRK